jgi:hypothetical protein
MIVCRPSSSIAPCQPPKVARPPSGPLWVHEIKHDGYRRMVRRDGSRVRCFTRNGMTGPTAFPPSWTTWCRGRRRVGRQPGGTGGFREAVPAMIQP